MRWFVRLGLAMLLLAAANAQEGVITGIARPIPDAAKRIRNPVPATPEALETGKNLFSSQCAMCHGANGDGNGDLALRLELSMPDFRDQAKQRERTDGEWFYIVTEGHGRMPGEGSRLPDNTKWNMIHFIRSLAGRTGAADSGSGL